MHRDKKIYLCIYKRIWNLKCFQKISLISPNAHAAGNTGDATICAKGRRRQLCVESRLFAGAVDTRQAANPTTVCATCRAHALPHHGSRHRAEQA